MRESLLLPRDFALTLLPPPPPPPPSPSPSLSLPSSTVHLDGAQFRWLELEVSRAEARGRPVVVFTHAPPAGCGLRVVQAVHVRNRCAYLNHGALDGEEKEGEGDGGGGERVVGGEGGGREGNEVDASPPPSSSSAPPSSAAAPPPPPPPDAFIRLVERHANVRLWFSGHYHLSHNYATSVSAVNGCAFVQVGVIGPRSTRDGLRQSRVLDGDAGGFRLLSLDHETGEMRLDATGEWGKGGTGAGGGEGAGEGGGAGGKRRGTLEVVPVPRGELLDPAADVSWLSSQLDCGVIFSDKQKKQEEEKEKREAGEGEARDDGGQWEEAGAWPAPAAVARALAAGSAAAPQWLPAGGDALLALSPSSGDLLEYSARMRCPVGFVLDNLPRDRGELRARLVSADGEEVFPNSYASGGSSGSDGEGCAASSSSSLAAQEAAAARAAAVEVVVASTGEVVGRRGRNAKGSFYHVFQPNKWRKKVAALEAEAEARRAAVV